MKLIEINVKLIELCRYTLKQSLNDTGDYSQYEMSAEDIVEGLK